MRMSKSASSLLLGAAIVMSSAVLAAPTSDPEVMVAECSAEMVAVSQDFQATLSSKVDRAMPRIKSLIDSGQVDRARDVADRTILQVRRTSLRGENKIIDLHQACREELLQMGEVEMAETLRQNYVASRQALLDHKNGLIGNINALFP